MAKGEGMRRGKEGEGIKAREGEGNGMEKADVQRRGKGTGEGKDGTRREGHGREVHGRDVEGLRQGGGRGRGNGKGREGEGDPERDTGKWRGMKGRRAERNPSEVSHK